MYNTKQADVNLSKGVDCCCCLGLVHCLMLYACIVVVLDTGKRTVVD